MEHCFSILTFIYMMLLPRNMGEACEPSEKVPLLEIGERWTEKHFHF
jgi:hypothetical protein